MLNEMWLFIKEYEEMYEVSNMGIIRSLKRKGQPHILFQSTDSAGRKTVSLWKFGKEKRYKVHNLVLIAFRGIRPKGMEVCHNDGNASNNNIFNLRWDTHISNCQDRKKHGKEKGMFVKGSEGNPKIGIEDIKEIRKIGRTQSQESIASKYLIGRTQISNILLGYCWKNV